MKLTVLILSGAQDAVLVLEISDFRHMPWALTCFIILIDYTANKINLCFIDPCFVSKNDFFINKSSDQNIVKRESWIHSFDTFKYTVQVTILRNKTWLMHAPIHSPTIF